MKKYRSIQFDVKGVPDIGIIEKAAKLGFNDIQLHTQNGTLGPLAQVREWEDEFGFIKRAKDLGMTLSMAIHELEDYDESWGEPAADNEKLWKGLGDRYDRIFTEQFPEIDYLVLTVVECSIQVTGGDMLVNLVSALNDACRRHGRKMVFRTFVHAPEQCEDVKAVLEKMPGDVMIETKCVPQDWHMRSMHHPMLGDVGGREQIVELDVAGEYFRNKYLAHCFTDVLFQRFKHWQETGCIGLSVRVDRKSHPMQFDHSEIRDHVQEANLYALGYLMESDEPCEDDVERAWQDYAVETFGEKTASVMIEALKPTGQVNAEGFCVDRETFGDMRKRVPGIRAMQDENRQPIIAAAYPDDEDAKNRNPFHMNWSVHRWDPSLKPAYHKLRRGDPEVIERKKRAYAEQLESARKSISLLDSVKDDLPEGGYDFVKFKLQENEFHLIVMCEAELAWLKASRILYEGGEENKRLVSEIKAHLGNLEALLPRLSETCHCRWKGREWDLRRAAYLELDEFLSEFRRHWAEVIK